ncbi:PAQR family membrane homeostasis protein TrhA [Constantimarinum furrinae]|uniref:Hemolysin n=1 Tax=Constantimarinum furrinae TaxID=2562285 RepID=A0A7G8PX46_9FLAO|nr:hemolysin III family protein [Constantimarinum furrinae]QNJ98912.1 hemolysin [Constantimarinum furrinae]
MYSKKEEFWHAISHGIGIALGILGLVLLVIYDSGRTDFSTLSVWIYGFSIITLYTASTVYHAVSHEKWKNILRKIDHISIYLLIAGTYTPVVLISLEESAGWIIFWVVWGIAALGTILKIFFTGRFEIFSLSLYVVMGWLIAFDFSNLAANQSDLGITLLALGGALYMLGIIFYVVKRIPYNHLIWHFFVLGGSICHFMFIFLDII